MKKACIATILAVLLFFGAVGMANTADDKRFPETKKPTKLIEPHPVTMEEWTNIVRSLRKEKKRPDKPFRLRLKQKKWVEL